MKKIAFLLMTLVPGSSCIQRKNEAVKGFTPGEVQSLLEMEDEQLVDVRTPEEFSGGYIVGAQNIDYQSPTFEEDIRKLDKNKPVILYCKSGVRSSNCADIMIKAGFEKVYDLQGGISKWKHKGFTVKIKS